MHVEHARPGPPARSALHRARVGLLAAAAASLALGAAAWPTSAGAVAPALAPSTTAPRASTSTAKPTTTASTAPRVLLPAVGVPAGATKVARRLRQAGSIMFPMDPTPTCTVLDSFSDRRSGGRSHEGVDILATLGQAVYAVADGVLTKQYVAGGANSSLSGNAWQLNASDGSGAYYFYAHLSGFREGLAVGSTVRRGDVIGHVGDTGNPGAGNFHLHFEVHPSGGAAVDPLPLLELPASCKVF